MRILWIDDEIEMFKAHRLYLESKGYEVRCCTNGYDALEELKAETCDLIFLDENMPGLSGLDTLSEIKVLRPEVPVVMVTKNEEENIMDQAIGSKIADYLIKPVNPSQLLICVKKNIDSRRLINETTQTKYQSQFSNITMQTMECRTFDDWARLYQKLVFWELELQYLKTLDDIQLMQKQEANLGFVKFVRNNYVRWFTNPDEAPLMSHRVMSRRVLPLLDKGEKIVLIVIDNFRLDQWETIRPLLAPDFNIDTELYSSILPTATMYARNALVSGLMPLQIKQLYPQYWIEENDDDETSQNQYENQLVGTLLERYRKHDMSYGYYKINDAASGSRLLNIFPRYKQNNLNVFVYNFVDMLSHARTDIKMVKELSNDEAAYRSITKSWFEHSALYELMLEIKNQGTKIMLTTDHGAIRVTNPQKIVGDRDLNTNLRYKTGKKMSYNEKNVFAIQNPEAAMLPRANILTSFAFAEGNDFFVYPNNMNQYVQQFNDTFQHGGISMEEMIIPLVTLEPK